MFKIIGGVGRKCRICWTMVSMAILLVNLFSILLDNSFVMAAGLRPSYVYDYANIIDSNYESVIEGYLRAVDKATSTEIIIYTIPSFIGRCADERWSGTSAARGQHGRCRTLNSVGIRASAYAVRTPSKATDTMADTMAYRKMEFMARRGQKRNPLSK